MNKKKQQFECIHQSSNGAKWKEHKKEKKWKSSHDESIRRFSFLFVQMDFTTSALPIGPGGPGGPRSPGSP